MIQLYYSEFGEFILQQAERSSENEVVAANATLLAEINCDKGLENYDNLKKEVDVHTIKRIEISTKLK